MELFYISILSTFYLYGLNYILIKLKFSLDKATKFEKHKLFLTNQNYKIPVSGFIFFVPFVIFFLKDQNFNILFFTLAVFLIGFLSDIKILKSPKLRLIIQISLITIFVYLSSNLSISTRIDYLDTLNSNEIFRIFFVTICFLVLINGYNFIDGVNNLCSLNFLIVLIILYIFFRNNMYEKKFIDILYLIIPLSIFCFFNFFNKNFLGDGAAYGLSFLIGYLLINLSLYDEKISPYFIVNLLFYPAFENLFTIIRRVFNNKKNYLPDNSHLHHLLFKYIAKTKIFEKKYIISSFVGIIINTYLLIFYLICMTNYSDTKFQMYLILFNIFIYIFVYRKLKK